MKNEADFVSRKFFYFILQVKTIFYRDGKRSEIEKNTSEFHNYHNFIILQNLVNYPSGFLAIAYL
jgi:hypothetical protein